MNHPTENRNAFAGQDAPSDGPMINEEDRALLHGLWNRFQPLYPSLAASCNAVDMAWIWVKHGFSFFPLELERLGIQPGKTLKPEPRSKTHAEAYGHVNAVPVMAKSHEAVRFFLHEPDRHLAVTFRILNGMGLLTGIKLLTGPEGALPVKGLAIGRPRPNTETLVHEHYLHEADQVTRILRRGEHTDRGRTLMLAEDFEVEYGSHGELISILGWPRHLASGERPSIRVYPNP